jgi:hypothetical protein
MDIKSFDFKEFYSSIQGKKLERQARIELYTFNASIYLLLIILFLMLISLISSIFLLMQDVKVFTSTVLTIVVMTFIFMLPVIMIIEKNEVSLKRQKKKEITLLVQLKILNDILSAGKIGFFSRPMVNHLVLSIKRNFELIEERLLDSYIPLNIKSEIEFIDSVVGAFSKVFHNRIAYTHSEEVKELISSLINYYGFHLKHKAIFVEVFDEYSKHFTQLQSAKHEVNRIVFRINTVTTSELIAKIGLREKLIQSNYIKPFIIFSGIIAVILSFVNDQIPNQLGLILTVIYGTFSLLDYFNRRK